jgi:hypothetical protein
VVGDVPPHSSFIIRRINFNDSLIAHRFIIIASLHHHPLSTIVSCLLIGERGVLLHKGPLIAMHRQLIMALGGLCVLPPVKAQGGLCLRQHHHVRSAAVGGQAHLLIVAPPLSLPPLHPPPLPAPPPPCLAFVGLRGPVFCFRHRPKNCRGHWGGYC